MQNLAYPAPDEVRAIGVLGVGSVGASWSALFLAHGIDVYAFDPGKGARSRARSFIQNAWPALHALNIAKEAKPPLSRLRFVDRPEDAALAGDVIQENLPEDPQLKRQILSGVDRAADPGKIILSSTGGIPPTELQRACKHPERFVVVHPFNPTHLIPLVEVIGGKRTSSEIIDWAMEFSRYLGKQPIRLNAEATGHMTNRLQFALVREAVACLMDGIASAKDIDTAVQYGLAPRWALMGSLLTLHLAGGAGGMKGILDHAGPAIEEWWTPRSTPHLNSEVKQRLIEAADEIANGASTDEWARWRDERLVEVIRLQRSKASEAQHRVEGGAHEQ